MKHDPTRGEPRLCCVDGRVAYFTTQPVHQQWGDDWNDAPYEHNAGSPYTWDSHDAARGEPEWTIIEVTFAAGRLMTPDYDDRGGGLNTPWCVQAINLGATQWLTTRHRYLKEPEDHVDIWAGVTIAEFTALVQRAGGTVQP